MYKLIALVLLAATSSTALAGSFMRDERPATMNFDYVWTGITHGQIDYSFLAGGSRYNPSLGGILAPFRPENRMVCGNVDFCVSDATFTTGNSGNGIYRTRARRIESTCAIDPSADPPTGDGWYWVGLFFGYSMEPTRCTVHEFIAFDYEDTEAHYEGTAEIGSIVFWRGYDNGDLVGTVPTLTNWERTTDPDHIKFSGTTSIDTTYYTATGTFTEN